MTDKDYLEKGSRKINNARGQTMQAGSAGAWLEKWPGITVEHNHRTAGKFDGELSLAVRACNRQIKCPPIFLTCQQCHYIHNYWSKRMVFTNISFHHRFRYIPSQRGRGAGNWDIHTHIPVLQTLCDSFMPQTILKVGDETHAPCADS